MAKYKSIRFRGTIKKEYRQQFDDIITSNDWYKSDIKQCKAVGEYNISAKMLKMGCYFPEQWYDCDKQDGEYRTHWSKEDGIFVFAFTYDTSCNSDFDTKLIDALKEISEHIDALEVFPEN